jgi:hypothetical protein
LGHVISLEGIMVDPSKVRDVLDWQPLRSPSPSPSLLKKGTKCVWSEACDEAFQTLMKLLTTSPVLAQPDIAKYFDVYCDDSGTRLGYVLMQEGKVIGYSS